MNEPLRMKSGRGSRITAFGLLLLLLTFAMGNRACNDDMPAISCHEVRIVLAPGECQEIPNPCSVAGEGWALPPDIDGFKLDPQGNTQLAVIAAEQFSLTTTRAGANVVRTVCVGDNAPFISEAEVDYFYGHGVRFGLGAFRLTVSNEFRVAVTASPANIAFGEESQLLASVSGGIGPYFYTWGPNTGLNFTNVAAPVASPGATTTYTVSVSDSSGQFVTGTVTVFVRLRLRVTADGPIIQPGQISQLDAIAEGGSPPYTYTWTPADTLTNPNDSAPIARPLTTTTYNVVVVDSVGATLNGSVTVTVTASPPLNASFTYFIGSGPSIHLNASGSTGQITSYIWDLSWTPASPDLVTTSPFATFAIREIDSGTITLTVTDAAGNRATSSQPF